MNEYSEFSQVYDIFMDNIPYREWFEQIRGILHKYGKDSGIVAELGCGTGVMTELMAQAGYDMIGIDCSVDMLQNAICKREKSGLDSILYLNQDMREFELYGTVSAVISVCDSVNYLLEPGEVEAVFRLVYNYLDPGGLLIFDFTTGKKYENIGDSVIGENREEGSFIWENTYYEDEKINEYEITLFLPDGEGKYNKYSEIHQQRAYSQKEMRALLERAGFAVLSAADGYTDRPAGENSERIVITAKKEIQ